MEITNTNILKVKPYGKNAKKHPKQQIQQIANSIQAFGFNQPIVVDKDYVVIVGHGRLEAAKALGLNDVPTLVLDITEEHAKAYRLADNKLNESDWDMDMVIEELKLLSPHMIDLTGFDPKLALEDKVDEDDAPEAPEEPKSKTGDVYRLGKHTVACMDSTDPATYDKTVPDMADMVFTDPPYNVNYKGSGKNTSNTILNDSMTNDAFDEFLRDFLTAIKDKVKRSAGIYIFHSHKTAHQFENAIKNTGYKIDTQLIWNKPNAGLGMNHYRTKHEPFFYCSIGDKKNFYGERDNTTVWKIPENEADRMKWWLKYTEKEDSGTTSVWTMRRAPVHEYVHPTQKPVELVQKAIYNSSKADDVVLDPFGWSGSTLIAAEKTGRRAVLIELDPKYVDVIVQRWVDYTGTEDIIKNNEPVVWQKTK